LNGPVIGGGVELALAFDLRVASASSFLRFAQTRMEITTGWQGVDRLCQLVGYSTALYWLLTSKQVSAETAEQAGLVNAVWPDDAFDVELDHLIDALMDAGEAGLAMKRVLREGVGRTNLSTGELERKMLRSLWQRPERQSAMKSALQRSRSHIP
jgi:enoyl-CoA hydratase/carnithine racemase